MPLTLPPLVQTVVQFAESQIGEPYKWGAMGPGAWDCSGLTAAAYQSAGVNLPHNARAQYAATSPVSTPMPGDLVFFGSSAGDIHHVGIYLGGDQMVDAPNAGSTVGVHKIYPDVFGYTRPLAGTNGVPLDTGGAGVQTVGDKGSFNPLSPSDWQAMILAAGMTVAGAALLAVAVYLLTKAAMAQAPAGLGTLAGAAARATPAGRATRRAAAVRRDAPVARERRAAESHAARLEAIRARGAASSRTRTVYLTPEDPHYSTAARRAAG